MIIKMMCLNLFNTRVFFIFFTSAIEAGDLKVVL